MSTLRFYCFQHDDALECNKLWDYYNNDQHEYIKAMLDGSFKGGYGKRRDWANRGMIPRTRNVTKSIVDKSAQVFNQPPTLETYSFQKKVIDNPTLDSILTNSDWLSFWQSVSAMTRLLKSVVVYSTKYIPLGSVTENQIYKFNPFNGEALHQIVTHHGNSEVIMDPTNRFIIEYAYITDLDAEYMEPEDDEGRDKPKQYVVVTPNEIETWVYRNEKNILVDVQPNPEGFVTAFFVHDTNKPLAGYDAWNQPGRDLGDLNEMVNLHITDNEFAIAWQKQKTLFTNGNIVDVDNPAPMVPAAMPGHTAPGAFYDNIQNFQNNGSASVGGLGAIVQITADDNSRDPMIKYDGPTSDLLALNETMHAMMEDVANDWDVNMRIEGKGAANSGFQLIVEEMDGLALRTKQIHFYQASFRIMYEILQRMYPELPRGTLLINFAPPSLPVNEKEREDGWVSKIAGGRASIVDYLMEQNNLTQEEAIEKATEIKTFNSMFATAVVPPVTANTASSTNTINPADEANIE